MAATAALVGLAVPGPATAVTAPPHWGRYQWFGGNEKADIRAYWLFDRTGNAQMHKVINAVAGGWNAARTSLPELPYIAVYQDDAHAGSSCFVNRTPGYSVASTCTMPQDIHGVTGLAARNADAGGHLVGAAFAVSEGLTDNQAISVTCHVLGHVMGLEDSDDATSCMSPTAPAPRDDFKWYTPADAEYILDVYAHSDSGASTTTSTTAPTSTTTPSNTTTSTTMQPTTTSTTEAPTTTSTTEAPSTTTSTTCVPLTAVTTTELCL